jgi:charged multivesicular body protein 2A
MKMNKAIDGKKRYNYSDCRCRSAFIIIVCCFLTCVAYSLVYNELLVPAINKMMVEFERENMKSEMMQEMMGDAIDDVMDQEGNADEEDKIVSQVLDEIGVSFGEEVPDAPSLGTGLKQSSNTEKERIPEAAGGGNDTALNDLEARLNNLKQ